jgi:hypothetical protein
MYRQSIKLIVLLIVLLGVVAVVSASDSEQKGPFSLSAASNGDTDTLTFDVQAEDGDKLEIKLDIDLSEGEWKITLEDPNGKVIGSMVSAQFDNDEVEDANQDDADFKVEIKGAVESGQYVLTFTNTGSEAASIAGEYKVELKDDDRFFYDPGAKIVLYIQVNIIRIWGVGDNGEGYEAIVISLDDIKNKIKQYKHGKGHRNFVFVSFDELDLEENLLLMESKNKKVRLYILTTGEFQVMTGPFEDGTTQVFIYDTFPPTRIYRADFNVYSVLRELNAQGSQE